MTNPRHINQQGAPPQGRQLREPTASRAADGFPTDGSGGTAAMQGEPVLATPADGFDLPEGLKRQPMGPYSRDKGRGNDKLPDHVPGVRPPNRD